jgi:hypothetical protein
MEISIAIALVIGVTEVIKRAFKLKSRFAPAVSLILGVSIMFLGDFPIKETLISGMTVGLMAGGLYSGVKATLKK